MQPVPTRLYLNKHVKFAMAVYGAITLIYLYTITGNDRLLVVRVPPLSSSIPFERESAERGPGTSSFSSVFSVERNAKEFAERHRFEYVDQVNELAISPTSKVLFLAPVREGLLQAWEIARAMQKAKPVLRTFDEAQAEWFGVVWEVEDFDKAGPEAVRAMRNENDVAQILMNLFVEKRIGVLLGRDKKGLIVALRDVESNRLFSLH